MTNLSPRLTQVESVDAQERLDQLTARTDKLDASIKEEKLDLKGIRKGFSEVRTDLKELEEKLDRIEGLKKTPGRILAKLVENKSYKDLHTFVDAARIRVSFWGLHRVSFQGIKGSVSLDQLKAKVIALVKTNFEFNVEERVIGKAITNKISLLDKQAEQSVKNRNFMTRIFYALGRWFAKTNDPLKNWKDKWQQTFEFYTQTQYQQSFNKKPVGVADWRLPRTPDRWKGSR